MHHNMWYNLDHEEFWVLLLKNNLRPCGLSRQGRAVFP